MQEDSERYSRQLVIEGFGREGQEKLRQGKALVVGVGGLGCAVLNYLAAVGVGTLGLVDYDQVSISNLNRQVLHWTEDAGRWKTESAAEKLARLNPEVRLFPVKDRLDEEALRQLIVQYDVVLDCTDSLTTRAALNRVAVGNGKPLVHGGVSGFSGQVTAVLPGKGPCLACFMPEDPEGKEREGHITGVLGPLPGIIGAVQALEAVKILTGIGKPLAGRMLVFDGLEACWEEVKVERNPSCPVCGRVQDIDRV